MKDPETGKRKNKFKTYLFLIVGGVMAGYGLFSYLSDYFFMKNAVAVNGTVIEMYMDEDGKRKFDPKTGKKSKSYYGVVQYIVEGNSYRHTVKDSQKHGFAEGDNIKIYYDPQDPADARITKENTLVQLAVGGMGAVLFLFGVAMFFAKEKVAPRNRNKKTDSIKNF